LSEKLASQRVHVVSVSTELEAKLD